LCAVPLIAWRSLPAAKCAVARVILLAFLLKLAQRCGRTDAVADALDAVASAYATGLLSGAENAVHGLLDCPAFVSSEDWRVRRALTLVHDRARGALRVTELARAVCRSGSHLQRLTKQHTGTPLRVHIATARLALAADLLEQGCISIKEVA